MGELVEAAAAPAVVVRSKRIWFRKKSDRELKPRLICWPVKLLGHFPAVGLTVVPTSMIPGPHIL